MLQTWGKTQQEVQTEVAQMMMERREVWLDYYDFSKAFGGPPHVIKCWDKVDKLLDEYGYKATDWEDDDDERYYVVFIPAENYDQWILDTKGNC